MSNMAGLVVQQEWSDAVQSVVSRRQSPSVDVAVGSEYRRLTELQHAMRSAVHSTEV